MRYPELSTQCDSIFFDKKLNAVKRFNSVTTRVGTVVQTIKKATNNLYNQTGIE